MVAIDLVSRSVGLNDMDGGDEATNMERPRKKTDPDQWRAHKPTEIGPSDGSETLTTSTKPRLPAASLRQLT